MTAGTDASMGSLIRARNGGVINLSAGTLPSFWVVKVTGKGGKRSVLSDLQASVNRSLQYCRIYLSSCLDLVG